MSDFNQIDEALDDSYAYVKISKDVASETMSI